MPIELLDVAGLVPGAHQGKGLGNKFLDDLRHADALIHVVDVSGTTDAEGKATRGYDPAQDIVWLRSEITRWILGNLMDKWYVMLPESATEASTDSEKGLDKTKTCCSQYVGLLCPYHHQHLTRSRRGDCRRNITGPVLRLRWQRDDNSASTGQDAAQTTLTRVD